MKLMVKRNVYVPTYLGLVIFLISTSIFFVIIVRSIYPFLAINDPIEANILIVEGWAPDVVEHTIKEFNQKKYEKIITIGGQLTQGHLCKYDNYADLAKASLISYGIEPQSIISLPAPPVKQNRTMASMNEVRKWLRKQDQENSFKAFNIISHGPHTRRSKYLLRKTLHTSVEIGSIAVKPTQYNSEKWWTNSAGIRSVLYEVMAYTYTIISNP